MADKLKVAVIGGGAAGLLAASQCAARGCDVTLYEKNQLLGKKLSITGKGRCNLTNHTSADEFLANVCTNPKFLYSAIHTFGPDETMAYFEGLGVPLKTERGNRVFPVSDRAKDIVGALAQQVRLNYVRVIHNKADRLEIENQVLTGVRVGGQLHSYHRAIVCTGGLSYPGTGSTGDGFKFAEQAGLTVVPPAPSLVPIETEEAFVKLLMGLSLKNVGLRIEDTVTKKTVYEDFGELLFTHFGLSGPMILSASCHISKIEKGRFRAFIDLKPALDEAMLHERLLRDFTKYANKNFVNSLDDLLPRKLIPVFTMLSGIAPEQKVNSITREQRGHIVKLLKALPFTLKRFRPLSEAIITSGGVAVSELNPKTMESKKIKNLYFAGEVIDVDAYTGGFNLQIAFSTAFLAAKAASAHDMKDVEKGNSYD